MRSSATHQLMSEPSSLTSSLTSEERANPVFTYIVESVLLYFFTKYVLTSPCGAKPLKLKFRANRGCGQARLASLSASRSRNTCISSLLEREILLRKPYTTNERGENIEICIFRK